jgi:glycosyltransferase involved in cell wall biosynthesis
LNIIHNLYCVGPGSFGLGPVALNLCRSQNALGMDSSVWCLDSEDERQWASTTSGLAVDKIRSFPFFGPKKLSLSLEMERVAEEQSANISIVHQHALWVGVSRVTAQLRERHGIPSIITPHGSLERWAIKKSWWKKRLVLGLYERNNLFNASCLHAVGKNEIADCRDFGLKNPIAVIPNGIPSDWLESEGDANAFRVKCGIPADKRVLLFLSRITPKKGLPMLMEALHENRKQFADWHFVIAGSDEFGHQAEVQSCIDQKSMGNNVSFVGSLHGQIKRDAFAAADLFVLPSYSEGAPIVILEALGASVPVLATKASPWQELETHDCGWLVDISARALAEALQDALARTPNDLQRMGQRGRELVAAQYTWDQSARMTIELYEWLLHRRERPDFVVVD